MVEYLKMGNVCWASVKVGGVHNYTMCLIGISGALKGDQLRAMKCGHNQIAWSMR